MVVGQIGAIAETEGPAWRTKAGIDSEALGELEALVARAGGGGGSKEFHLFHVRVTSKRFKSDIIPHAW